jgi:hypothetical protein
MSLISWLIWSSSLATASGVAGILGLALEPDDAPEAAESEPDASSSPLGTALACDPVGFG